MIFLVLFFYFSNVNAENLIQTNNILTNQVINIEKIENFRGPDTNISQKSLEMKKLNYYDYIWKSALCPGLGHYFLKSYTKALFFYTSFILTTGMGIYFYQKADKIYQDYLKATTTTSAVSLYDDYIKIKKTSDTFFYFSIFIWAYNIFDVLLDVKWINDNLKLLKDKNVVFLNLYEDKF